MMKMTGGIPTAGIWPWHAIGLVKLIYYNTVSLGTAKDQRQNQTEFILVENW